MLVNDGWRTWKNCSCVSEVTITVFCPIRMNEKLNEWKAIATLRIATLMLPWKFNLVRADCTGSVSLTQIALLCVELEIRVYSTLPYYRFLFCIRNKLNECFAVLIMELKFSLTWIYCGLLGYVTVLFGKWVPCFLWNILPSSAGAGGNGAFLDTTLVPTWQNNFFFHRKKSQYRRPPFIRINWDAEPSRYAENPDNWIFLWK